MKIIYISLILALILGCDNKCKYVEPGQAGYTIFNLDIFSAVTREPLIKDLNSRYSKADIKIFDEDKKPLEFTFREENPQTDKMHYSIVVNGIKNTKAFNTELCAKLYVDLKDDRDTLAYCYSVKSTICGGSEIEYLNATYNGIKIESQTPNTLASFEYKILK